MHPTHTIEQSPAQRFNLTPMDSFAQQTWYLAQRILAAMLLLMMAPLFALLFLLVRGTSRGPFIYRQKRPGRFGKTFIAYKIRSMRIGADRDARLARSVKSSNPLVTPIGRVLRDLKLDELPQLWNVVRGEMALVGPRPIAVTLQKELEAEIGGFERRLRVRPGLTNLGQVCVLESADPDRVVDDWRMRFEAEEHYLENRSATYDVIIMVVTVMYVMRKVFSRLSPVALRASMAVLALFAVVGLTGCATAGPAIPQESAVVSKTRVGERDAALHPATQDVERVEILTAAQGEPEAQYRVGPGDTLSINIFGEPGMSDLRVPIDADGYIQLPVLQRAQVGGKTTTEIQANLIESYRVEFNNPWVVVVVADFGSRPLYLLGEFNAPGMVYLDRPTNIIQALGRGKGLSENAYLRGARLLRQNDLVPVDINGLLKNGQADQNMWLESGDTIFVPGKDEQKVIVLGAVNQPGAIVYDNEGMGLVEAIAQAKDIKRGVAKMEDVRIIRSLSTVTGEFITVDAERIFSGMAPDFPLHAGDVVYVPQTALGDWNDVVAAIKPSFDLVVTSLQPFVQLKVLADL